MQSPHALYSDAFPREYGHAFWLLEPNDEPYDYFTQGVQIGDVLVLTPDGGYDYLFNICRPKDDPVNAGRTYEGFKPLPPDLETSTRARWQNAGSCLGSSGGKIFSASASASAPGLPVPVGAGLGFSTSHSSGALLILPDGASRTDLRNHRRFKDWIMQNIHDVFEHVNGDRFGREATSIFIVTGCDKSTESIVAASTNASDLHKFWLNLNIASVGVDLSYSSSFQCPSSTRVTPISFGNDGTKNKNHCAFARGLTCTKRRDPIRSRITIKVGDISTDESWDVEDKSGGGGFWPFSSFRSRSSSSSGRSSGSSPPSTSSSTRSSRAPSLSCSPTSSCEDLSNPSCPELIWGDSDDERDSHYESDDDGEIYLSFPKTSRRDPWTEMNEHFLRMHPDYDYVISHTSDLPLLPEQVPLLPEDHDVSLAVHEIHPEHTSNQALDRSEPFVNAPSQETGAVEEPSSSSSQCSSESEPDDGSDRVLQSVLCMYDFKSNNPVHLPFDRNEILDVVQMEDTSWWAAMKPSGDVIGWIPQSFVRPLSEEMTDRLRNVRQELRVYEYEAEQLYTSAPISPSVPLSEPSPPLPNASETFPSSYSWLPYTEDHIQVEAPAEFSLLSSPTSPSPSTLPAAICRRRSTSLASPKRARPYPLPQSRKAEDMPSPPAYNRTNNERQSPDGDQVAPFTVAANVPIRSIKGVSDRDSGTAGREGGSPPEVLKNLYDPPFK